MAERKEAHAFDHEQYAGQWTDELLDEYDVEELQRSNCSVPKSMDINSQMMNIDGMGACTKVVSLTIKVLKREHGSALSQKPSVRLSFR